MRHKSVLRTLFEIGNYTLFTLFSITIVAPFLNAIAISLSSYQQVNIGAIGIWPKGFNWDAYTTLIHNSQFIRAFVNTVFLTIINTFLVILLALAAGYALAHKQLKGRGILFIYILIPMYFSGGLIPSYLLVNNIGLNNTYGALVFPMIVNVFYIIVFRNSIMQLPRELIEAAEIDGAKETQVLFKVIFPLVLPMTMAFVVFSAVAYWNEWFGVLLYIRDKSMWTLQYQLREILINADTLKEAKSVIQQIKPVHSENLKMAALMLTVLPIIMVYPFVQKYFIHGQLVGAVKG